MTESDRAVLVRLEEVQRQLKAPKNQRNSFGNYNYRSCEDILEAVKPFLFGVGLVLTISDDIVYVGDRYYVRATARVRDESGGEAIETTAYAREEETKKGMDGAQITGAASSYARKYALNGLFCIDDTKDADTDSHPRESSRNDAAFHQEYQQAAQSNAEADRITDKQRSFINALVRELGTDDEQLNRRIAELYGRSLPELSRHDASDLIDRLQARLPSADLAS